MLDSNPGRDANELLPDPVAEAMRRVAVGLILEWERDERTALVELSDVAAILVRLADEIERTH